MATEGSETWPPCCLCSQTKLDTAELLSDWLLDVFPVPVPYRKSLSWNTLRARKRAEAKDVSSVGVRGHENGLLRKPKETTPPPTLASPATRAKGKVSKAGRRRTLVMSCVYRNPSPATCPTCFLFFYFLTHVCARMCVCGNLQTHTVAAVSLLASSSGSQPASGMNLDLCWQCLGIKSHLN